MIQPMTPEQKLLDILKDHESWLHRRLAGVDFSGLDASALETIKHDIYCFANPRETCPHASQFLVFFDARNQSRRFATQCSECYATVSVVKKSTLTDNEIESAIPRIDVDFSKVLEERGRVRDSMLAEVEQRRLLHWRTGYEAYLQTSEWRAKRDIVLKRAQFTCEGCGISPATQVHHLTYDRVGHEMLFDLVAICADCHRQLHANKT